MGDGVKERQGKLRFTNYDLSDRATWRQDVLRPCVFARGGLCEREKGRIGEWVNR